MIHKYIFRDKPVVIDVNSGAVHMVDPVIYDALDFYRDKTCDKTAMEAALVPKDGAEALAEACSDIEELIAADMLFSDDEVSTEIFEKRQAAGSQGDVSSRRTRLQYELRLLFRR